MLNNQLDNVVEFRPVTKRGEAERKPLPKELKRTRPVKDVQTLNRISNYLYDKPRRPRDELNRYRDTALFVFGVNSLRRIQEILALRVEHVVDDYNSMDIKNKLFTYNLKGRKTTKEGKTVESERLIKFYTTLSSREKLRKYLLMRKESQGELLGNEYLFPGNNRFKPMTVRQAQYIIGDAARACGVEHFGTHGMRKTKAYLLAENEGAPIYKLSDMLGHRDEKTTRHYVELDDEEYEEITNRNDLGGGVDNWEN